ARTGPRGDSMDSSSQSLCLRCGLCCDGTLFSYVPLKPGDEISPLKRAGINFRSDSDLKRIKQPCAGHKNCVCIVYDSRPQTCREYRCELLKKFEQNDILYEDAVRIINNAVSLKNELNAAALAVSTNTESVQEVLLLVKKWSDD